jgi:hypothetical protein
VSEDTACESVEGIELAFTRVDGDATAQRYRQDENEDPSLWRWRVWGNDGGGKSGGRSMTPVVSSSQRQRGFKVWATPQVAYYQSERGCGKKNITQRIKYCVIKHH